MTTAKNFVFDSRFPEPLYICPIYNEKVKRTFVVFAIFKLWFINLGECIAFKIYLLIILNMYIRDLSNLNSFISIVPVQARKKAFKEKEKIL